MYCALHSGVVDSQMSQKIEDQNKFQCPEWRIFWAKGSMSGYAL
jgi:hypothetical protein